MYIHIYIYLYIYLKFLNCFSAIVVPIFPIVVPCPANPAPTFNPTPSFKQGIWFRGDERCTWEKKIKSSFLLLEIAKFLFFFC